MTSTPLEFAGVVVPNELDGDVTLDAQRLFAPSSLSYTTNCVGLCGDLRCGSEREINLKPVRMHAALREPPSGTDRTR